jgi:hypothetical protein
MLGNDIVDLRDVDANPETFRPRFDARVFAPVERRAIERDANAQARRWAHWAAKEAAYKLAKQIDPDFVFSPSKLVAYFTEAFDQPGGRLQRRGTLTFETALGSEIRELELRSFETFDWVHVLALPAGADWEAVVSAVEPLEDSVDSSVAVRMLATRRIAQNLGVESERIAIGRRGRIPTLEIDGAPSTLAISLAHHGGWVACAMSLQCERGLPIRRAGVDERVAIARR